MFEIDIFNGKFLLIIFLVVLLALSIHYMKIKTKKTRKKRKEILDRLRRDSEEKQT